MSLKKTNFPLNALCLACCCISQSAFANSSTANQLETLEITADGNPQNTFERGLDIKRLSNNLAKDLQDTFKLDPSIQAGTGARNGQKLFLRGVEDLHLNVKIDGAKQGANMFHHQGRLQIDPFLLKRAKVLTGPAAADAGPGALGGSVIFETIDAQDRLAEGQAMGALIGGQYETSSQLKGGNLAAFGKLGENLGLLVYVRKNTNEEVRAGGGEKLRSTDGEHENYLIKASLLDLNGHSLRLSTQRSSDEGGALRANFPWQTNVGTIKGDDNQTVSDKSVNFRYTYQPEGQNWLNLQHDIYISETGIERFFTDGAVEWLTQSQGANLNNTGYFNLGLSNHALTYGVDYQRSKGISREPSQTLSEDAYNVGLYIQNRVELGNVRLSGGLRYDYYEANYAGKYQSSGSEVSPNLSAEWDLLTAFTLFAGYGQSIRGDRLNQAGWLNKYSESFELGNQGNLQPETATQYELGARWAEQSLWLDNDHTGVEISFYHTKINDYLITHGEGIGAKTDKIYNAEGDVTTQGFELLAHWGIEDLMLKATYSHNRFRGYDGQPGDTTGASARVGSSVGDRIVVDAAWQVQSTINLGYTLTSVQKLTDVRQGRPEKPGYVVHDLQLQWQPAIASNNLTLKVVLENLLDKQYAKHTAVRVVHTSGEELASWETGRNLRVGFDYKF